MARDTRSTRNGYYDRNKWYKRIKDSDQRDPNPIGIFYSTDVQVLSNTPYYIQGIFKGRRTGVIIKTEDWLCFGTENELKPDDWVEYGGELYRVDEVRPDDLNKNKQFSTRTRYTTTITLVR